MEFKLKISTKKKLKFLAYANARLKSAALTNSRLSKD